MTLAGEDVRWEAGGAVFVIECDTVTAVGCIGVGKGNSQIEVTSAIRNGP